MLIREKTVCQIFKRIYFVKHPWTAAYSKNEFNLKNEEKTSYRLSKHDYEVFRQIIFLEEELLSDFATFVPLIHL